MRNGLIHMDIISFYLRDYSDISRCPSRQESGQGILEYALIFSFVVVLLVVLLYFFGDQVRTTYQMILIELPF